MAFSENIKRKKLAMAQDRCENPNCKTPFKTLYIDTCEAHHIKAKADGGSDDISNCKILCIPCHKNTESYGKH